MKVLKSHRDSYFLQWQKEDYIIYGGPSSRARFDYVSIESMQRGDGTPTTDENYNLLKTLRESLPKQGMISPLILVATQNKYWAEWVPTSKNFWQIIPYVIPVSYTHLTLPTNREV